LLCNNELHQQTRGTHPFATKYFTRRVRIQRRREDVQVGSTPSTWASGQGRGAPSRFVPSSQRFDDFFQEQQPPFIETFQVGQELGEVKVFGQLIGKYGM